MRRLFLVLTIVLVGLTNSFAQEVDFEIPTEINIIQGRLAVAFTDKITKADANKIVIDMGYSVLQTNFGPRVAYALSEKKLTEKETNSIQNDSRVISITHSELQREEQTTSTGKPVPRYNIEVTFNDNVSEAEAKTILDQQSTAAFHLVKKPANELVIDVGDEDEVAFNALQNRQEVKWVTYVGIAENN